MKFLKKLERQERKMKNEGEKDDEGDHKIEQILEESCSRKVNGRVVNEEVLEVDEDEEELLEGY